MLDVLEHESLCLIKYQILYARQEVVIYSALLLGVFIFLLTRDCPKAERRCYEDV